MVSKASEDLPEPETPVTTVRRSMGMVKSTFFKLLTRAPRTVIASSVMLHFRRRHLQRPILRASETHIITRFGARTKWRRAAFGAKMLGYLRDVATNGGRKRLTPRASRRACPRRAVGC